MRARRETLSALCAVVCVFALLGVLDPRPAGAQEPVREIIGDSTAVFSFDPEQSAGFLRPGDLVRVQVWRQEELSGEFFVNEQGVLAHPLYNVIRVANRPVEEVPSLLWEFLTRFDQEPNFSVEPLFQVYVGGRVREPSLLFLRPGTSIAEAIATAGGITEDGTYNGVLLRRDGVEYKVDLSDPELRLQAQTVRSRDEIVVRRKRNWFRDILQPVLTTAGSAAWIFILVNGR